MNTRKIHLTLTVQSEATMTDAELRMIGHNAIAEVDHLAEATYTVVPLHPEGLPIDELRTAVEKYEDSIEDINADEFTEEALHLHDMCRALLATVDTIDPFGLAQAVLDAHAIRPDWKRNGQQILNLLVEGIVAAVGTPVAVTTTQAPALTSVDQLQSFAEDRELLDVVLAILPLESTENPMPFIEVVQRVTRKSGYTADEVRGALVALDAKGETVLQYGRGWSRTERD